MDIASASETKDPDSNTTMVKEFYGNDYNAVMHNWLSMLC
jgi:hypothetical protein